MELSSVDHGLNGEHVARLHDSDGFVFGVVGDGGGTVEQTVDAVAAVCPHNTALVRLFNIRTVHTREITTAPNYYQAQDSYALKMIKPHAMKLSRQKWPNTLLNMLQKPA